VPAPPEDVFFAPATALHDRLKRREFSAVDLAKAFAARLERLGPRWNALALPLGDLGRRLASAVDKELKRERFRGPLQGIPYAVKDLLSVAGQPTAWGAKPFAGQVFPDDAAVVERLNSAGGVLVGKLAMVELAGGGGYRYAAASATGPGLNPWDPTRWSGGSSSGSAAAVAAGLVPYALGSETNGSIVTPCAFCGVTGLRPTYGLVSRFGAMALAWTMDKIGPIARTAEDCGHVLAAIAGADARDPGSARRSFHFVPKYVRPVTELTVGYSPADFSEYADPELRPVLAAALAQFRQTGARLMEVELPDLPYAAIASTIISAEGSAAFAELISSGRVEQLADRRQIEGLKAGLRITAAEYLRAMQARRAVQASLARLFARVDLLLSPARYSVAPKIEEALDRPAGAAGARTGRGLRPLVPAGNLAGLPALILPAGLANGLPVAIALTGRPFSENTLLKVGLEFQAKTNFHAARPTLVQ
jgi:aspartyl-tRNA(Asn)/glutamyl-tRNA(Gln) amidotransferase subunit A